MAAARVQSIGTLNNGSAGTSVVLSVSVTVTVGNTILVAGHHISAVGGETMTDNLGNTYTKRRQVNAFSATVELWDAPVTIGGTLTTITFSWTTSAAYSDIVADEYSGVGAFQVADSATGESTTATWMTSQTVPAGGLAFGGTKDVQSSVTQTAGAASGSPSITIVLGQWTAGQYLGTAYGIGGASASTGFTGTTTLSSTNQWIGVGAVYAPTATRVPRASTSTPQLLAH